MWGGVYSLKLVHVICRRRQWGVHSNEETFMVSSGHGRRGVIVDAWSIFVFVTWLFFLRRVQKEVVAVSMAEAMSNIRHSAQECQCMRLLHGRNTGGRGGSQPSLEGEDLCENWFQLENSVEETQALMRLEGELNATLLFEHGGRQPTNMIWVARILLG